ncbi:MAG: phosphatase PAP2 family protein [Pseudomonadota bacterium]
MDRALLVFLNGLVALPGVREFCWLVDQPFSPLLLLLVVVVSVARRRRWWELLGGTVAVLISDPLCAQVLKPLIARPRPCVDLAGILAPFGCGPAFSMPSCHAANAFALAAVLDRPWAYGLALLIALSRAVAGVHYPSDLLAGALLGMAIGWPLRQVVVQLGRRKKKPASGPTRPGGIA